MAVRRAGVGGVEALRGALRRPGVGDSVGKTVGTGDGTRVGRCVGSLVGTDVGAGDGRKLGELVGTCVGVESGFRWARRRICRHRRGGGARSVRRQPRGDFRRLRDGAAGYLDGAGDGMYDGVGVGTGDGKGVGPTVGIRRRALAAHWGCPWAETMGQRSVWRTELELAPRKAQTWE